MAVALFGGQAAAFGRGVFDWMLKEDVLMIRWLVDCWFDGGCDCVLLRLWLLE